MTNRRNWIELLVAVLAFGALAGIVWLAGAPLELVPAIWMGGVLGVAGTGYWRDHHRPRGLRAGAGP
jgi:hypothetical protein